MVVQPLSEAAARERALARMEAEEQQRYKRQQEAAQAEARRYQEQADRARLSAEAEAVEIMRPLAALGRERQQNAREAARIAARTWRNVSARDAILSQAHEKVAPHWIGFSQLSQQEGWRELRSDAGAPDQLYVGDDAASRAGVVAIVGLENGIISPDGIVR